MERIILKQIYEKEIDTFSKRLPHLCKQCTYSHLLEVDQTLSPLFSHSLNASLCEQLSYACFKHHSLVYVSFLKRVLGEVFVQKICFSQRFLRVQKIHLASFHAKTSMHDNFLFSYARRFVCMQVKLCFPLIYIRFNIMLLGKQLCYLSKVCMFNLCNFPFPYKRL